MPLNAEKLLDKPVPVWRMHISGDNNTRPPLEVVDLRVLDPCLLLAHFVALVSADSAQFGVAVSTSSLLIP